MEMQEKKKFCFISKFTTRTSNRNMETFRCGYCEYKCGQLSDLILHITHKHAQNRIRKRKQNAYEVVRFPIIPENEMKKGNLLIQNEDRCTITICDIDEAYKMKTDVQLQYATLMKILFCPAQRE